MLSFRRHFLRQSQNLVLKYFPQKKVLELSGPQGAFLYKIKARLNYSSIDKKFWLTPLKSVKKSKFGLSQMLLTQSCLGVTLSYRRQLNLVGIGYQAAVEKEDDLTFLSLKLGFSHIVKVKVPDYIRVNCPKPRIILITGINLQKVNNFASLVRDLKLPNSYKEKGLYFKGESLRLKQGKKT